MLLSHHIQLCFAKQPGSDNVRRRCWQVSGTDRRVGCPREKGISIEAIKTAKGGGAIMCEAKRTFHEILQPAGPK